MPPKIRQIYLGNAHDWFGGRQGHSQATRGRAAGYSGCPGVDREEASLRREPGSDYHPYRHCEWPCRAASYRESIDLIQIILINLWRLPLATHWAPTRYSSRSARAAWGEVWKARDTRLDRIVAIKRSKAEFSNRFAREAKAIAALNHPNICQLYDVGPDYLVMEYVEGTPLKGPLPLNKA